MGDSADLPQLELISTIGFQGKVRRSLISHPDQTHVIYATGHTVIVKNVEDDHKKQYTLDGHTNTVTCLALSNDGTMLASGQMNFSGFKAEVIIWDFHGKKKYGSHSVHKVRVESVAFSSNVDYVVSLGGQDCRNVIIWDINEKIPLCGAPSASHITRFATQLCCANLHNDIFVTGRETLRVWKIDKKMKRLSPVAITMGKVKREILCIEIDVNDEFLYCGTATGDVLKFSLNFEGNGERSQMQPTFVCCLCRKVDKTLRGDSPLYSLGVTALVPLKPGGLLVGTGDGVVARVDVKAMECHPSKLKSPVVYQNRQKFPTAPHPANQMVEIVRTKVLGSVSAITLRGLGHQFYVGSESCEIYKVNLIEFSCRMLFTCHGMPINDVAFPRSCSELFATASSESIRVWSSVTSEELLRVKVPNMICNSLCIAYDGSFICSGWSDGKIRGHAPESGRELFIIEYAHQAGVSAIAGGRDPKKIVSGGNEGEVRIWEVTPHRQVFKGLMKEHRGAVTSVRIKSDDKECITSGADGSCIVWDLERQLRVTVVFANTLFQSVCYGPKECQIITCGTNRQIGFWEVFDGSQIRDLEGSLSGPVNALDISTDCEVFITGGSDRILKVWRYQEGVVTHVGLGHSEEITAICISPAMNNIISVSKDGSICIWKYPE